VVGRTYVPEAGDLIWLDFNPQVGREQSGRRPAVVLSPATYNAKSDLAIVCPVTTQIKGYPFEVPLPGGLPVSGAVLADHLKSLDWRQRRGETAGRISRGVMEDIRDRIAALLGFSA
jgi:mRNA interferase MazF